MLVDTDVIIWHLRGYGEATSELDRLNPLTLSAVSYLEILQGLRNKVELSAVKKMLEWRNALMLPLTDRITHRAILLMESMALSHGLQLGDALIAASALEHGLPLLTGNLKHFAAVPGLLVEGFSIRRA